MSFASIEYLAFLLGAVLVYRMSSRRARPFCLLVLSCLFYASWDARGLGLLAISAGVAYGMAFAIERTPQPRLRLSMTALTIAILTALLLLFKVLPTSWRPVSWLVPLGISYYTFKLLSYVIDVYWEKREAEHNIIALASYATFFPQIVAGPIQRSEDYLPQVTQSRPLSKEMAFRGIGRIAFGLFKKLAVADQLGVAVNAVYANPDKFHAAPLLLAFYLFPLQLYADFSGLTDIAVGSALLLGFESPENFSRPFAATSISDYWRRWHMSLTNWLADYVFMPLRMALRSFGTAGLVVAITANMVGIGLWHGISWGYLVFGLLHAAFLSVDALTLRSRNTFLRRNPQMARYASIAGWFVTFHAVALAMVFFRARTLHDATWLLRNMWSFSGLQAFVENTGTVAFVRGLVSYAIFELIDYLRQNPITHGWLAETPTWFRWAAYGACAGAAVIGLLLVMAKTASTTSFIYAIF